MTIEADKVYTPSELARELGAHKGTVRRWLRVGRLQASKNVLTGRYQIKGSDVLHLLKEAEEGKA